MKALAETKADCEHRSHRHFHAYIGYSLSAVKTNFETPNLVRRFKRSGISAYGNFYEDHSMVEAEIRSSSPTICEG